jgi:hypothetical protein
MADPVSVAFSGDNSCITIPVTILAGTTTSNNVYLGTSLSIIGILSPPVWTTAYMSFESSPNGVTGWCSVIRFPLIAYNVGADINRLIAVDFARMLPFMYVRLRSGTVNTPVIQGATSVVYLIARALT